MIDRGHRHFRKLDRIPGAPNFVRYNFEDLQQTLKAYIAFAKGMPTVSYLAALPLIRDRVLGLIDSAQANLAACRVPESPSRDAILSFVSAFCDYADSRNYIATPTYMTLEASAAIGRNLFIPVKPTLIARENGQLKPIFTFGWKSVPLTLFQRRLLMTILDDAIFSLTDFSDSDAEIVFFPEYDGVRAPEVWHRGDYELLSESVLREQYERFLTAREAAYPIIEEWLKLKGTFANRAPHDDAGQFNLELPGF